MTAPGVHRQVEQRLRSHELRYTAGRRRVVGALVDADGPRSAAELHAALGGALPLSSLYRSLSVLEDVGVVEPHLGARGLTRYELAEWLLGHHHHLVCLECGTVEDVDLDQRSEAKIRELVAAAGSVASFRATNHTLEIEGRCARCA